MQWQDFQLPMQCIYYCTQSVSVLNTPVPFKRISFHSKKSFCLSTQHSKQYSNMSISMLFWNVIRIHSWALSLMFLTLCCRYYEIYFILMGHILVILINHERSTYFVTHCIVNNNCRYYLKDFKCYLNAIVNFSQEFCLAEDLPLIHSCLQLFVTCLHSYE